MSSFDSLTPPEAPASFDDLQASTDALLQGCGTVDFEADTVQARARNGAPVAGPTGRSAASVYAPAYGATGAPPPPTPTNLRWSCKPGTGCVLDAGGPFTTQAACLAACSTPTQMKWSCKPGGCVVDAGGQYASQAACAAACGSGTQTVSYQCEGGLGCVLQQAPPDPTKGLYASLAECEQQTKCTGGSGQSISWLVVLLVILLLVGAGALVFF